MKRLLLALVPWMVLATAAYGQVRSADVVYTYVNTVPVRAYKLGDECFVPLTNVAPWGWQVTAKSDDVEIKAEGHTITEPVRVMSGDKCLPLRKTIKDIGGGSDWILGTDTLEVWANLKSISLKGGHLKFSSSMGIHPSGIMLTNPLRVVFDLRGARLSPDTKTDLDSGVKVSMFGANNVRVVMDAETAAEFPRVIEPARDFALDIAFSEPTQDEDTTKPTEPVVKPVDTPPIKQNATSTQLPLVVGLDGPLAALLYIRLPGGKTVTYQKPDPAVLEVRIPGVVASLPDDFRLGTDAVTSATTRIDGNATVLTLNLARPMGAEVWTDGDGVQIQISKPDIGNGRLAGKVVVVDPGHGGHDFGAHVGSVNEKDINLSIGRLLAAELAANGATVILTRRTDVFIPLSTRAEIANRNKADFFISSHINSNARVDSTSGTITFFHKGRSSSKVLAECIQKEISAVNGLPNIGVWSDGKIYNNGFAVLRQSSMPGVLLELGFINHSTDRARIQQKDFQASVAKAVVKGLKVFLGDE